MLRDKDSIGFVIFTAIIAGALVCMWLYSAKAFAIAADLNIFEIKEDLNIFEIKEDLMHYVVFLD